MRETGEIESYLISGQVERRQKTTNVTNVHLKHRRLSVLHNRNTIKTLISVAIVTSLSNITNDMDEKKNMFLQAVR